jgi:hypothetical protein
LSVMPFGEYGETPDGSDETITLRLAMTHFARSCGITKSQCHEIIEDMLSKTSSYSRRVSELKTVPDENKERLIRKTEDVRSKLQAYTHVKE